MLPVVVVAVVVVVGPEPLWTRPKPKPRPRPEDGAASEVGLRILSGLNTPLPVGGEAMVGRTGGCWADGRREKRGSKVAAAPASLALDGLFEALRALLPSEEMPRKSVLKVRCGGVASCGEAGRLSGLRNELPGRPSSQDRGRSGAVSRSCWRCSSFSASHACFCVSNSALALARAASASSARFLSASSCFW